MSFPRLPVPQAVVDVVGKGLFSRADYQSHVEAAKPENFYRAVWEDVGQRLKDSIARTGDQIEQERSAIREN
ncbi:MAG: hypothetical protein LBD68_09875 [Zoogloeaceae bacterium]|jgi:hypothetical protein|nr:hypothetical protein [Zoogloeaceae bacterium]